jgi:hypothetical protein
MWSRSSVPVSRSPSEAPPSGSRIQPREGSDAIGVSTFRESDARAGHRA